MIPEHVWCVESICFSLFKRSLPSLAHLQYKPDIITLAFLQSKLSLKQDDLIDYFRYDRQEQRFTSSADDEGKGLAVLHGVDDISGGSNRLPIYADNHVVVSEPRAGERRENKSP